MEAKIAAARLSPFKQPGGFKQPLEHFEACEGLQPNFSGVTGDAALLTAVERHRPKLAGPMAFQAMFIDFLQALGLIWNSFSWRPEQKSSHLGYVLQSLVLQELGSKFGANKRSAKLAGFKRNWREAKTQFARTKWPSCRNSWSDRFQGINHITLLTHTPNSHQGGCAGQADFLLSYWHRLCEAPAWRPQPASF